MLGERSEAEKEAEASLVYSNDCVQGCRERSEAEKEAEATLVYSNDCVQGAGSRLFTLLMISLD